MRDLDDAPEQEVEDAEARILDRATAARSIVELKAELETLKVLEGLALGVRRRGADTKWREFASLLGEIFTATGRDGRTGELATRDAAGAIPRPTSSPHQKLVVFTEHRDTLRYLQEPQMADLRLADPVDAEASREPAIGASSRSGCSTSSSTTTA